MPDIRVNDKVVDRLKTGFVLTPDDKRKTWQDLLDEQPLFRNLTAYIFNSVSNTSNMQKVRRVTRNLITLDDSDYEGTNLYFDEDVYDEYLNSFLTKIEKAELAPLVEALEGLGYVTSEGKNRAFSEGLRKQMRENKITLVDLGNDLKVSQLLGRRYGKGLDDTDVDDNVKDKKSAEKRREQKYSKRSSRLVGAFDRNEPILYPSTLDDFLETTGEVITIDTEGYFKKLFKVEGYGELGEDSFQFNAVTGKNLGVKELAQQKKKTQEEKDAEEEEAYQREMDREIAEGIAIDEDDDEGITQKMLRKAETVGSNNLVTLKILKDGKYELNVFGRKKAFTSDDAFDNKEELWEEIEKISLPNKKELIEIVRSQRKSPLKDAILGALTPRENKISLGKVKITLKQKKWKDADDFHDWTLKGGGRDADKKLNKSAKDMAKRVIKLKEIFDELESNWSSYVYDTKEAPFPRFIKILSVKRRKELVEFFNRLIVSIKNDNYNLSNPTQTETQFAPVINPKDDQMYNMFMYVLDKNKKRVQVATADRKEPKVRAVAGKEKPIGIEEIVYDKDGNPKKDKEGKVITEIKEYYPAFDNHDMFTKKVKEILSNIKSTDYKESVNIIPLLQYAGDTEELIDIIKEELMDSQEWKKEGDIEYKVSDTEGMPILTFKKDEVITTQVDTNIGRRVSRGKDRFQTGRFAEPALGASEKQIEDRKTGTDSNDAEEMILVYSEYEGLKEMIER